MRQVSKVLSVVGLLFLAAGVALAGDVQIASYLVRFHGQPAIRAGMDHQACVSKMQATCRQNLAAFQKAFPAEQVSPLWIINSAIVRTTPEVARQMAGCPTVAAVRPATYRIWIERGVDLQAVESGEKEIQWSIAKVRAPEVWKKFNIDGSGVVVGHLDTGVDGEHPLLKGKILLFKDFSQAGKSAPYDDQGHGTHTAGSIAGSNGIGVAPGARLIVGKIFDSQGGADDVSILAAMQWMLDPDGNPATNDAPRIVSNSWGSDASTDKSLWDAVNAWVTAGIVPVFAAGNAGPNGKVGTPGGFPHAWAVGATTPADGLANFSSIGPVTWDGKTLVKPDIAAPGAGVVSAAIGGGLVKNSGTSMACPHVAGLVALMLQANPRLTINQVRATAESAAIDLGTPGKDNKFGAGRFDAVATLEKVLARTDLFASLQAYDQALQAERALIGIQPVTPLSEPLARSIIVRGLDLDEGEFQALAERVSAFDSDAMQGLLAGVRTARRHASLVH